MNTERVDIKSILADLNTRRELMINSIIAIQAREGITTTREQAERAYDAIDRSEWVNMYMNDYHVG